MNPQEVAPSRILTFLLGGKCAFTISSSITNTRITYRLVKHRTKPVYFLYHVFGTNLSRHTAFLGTFFPGTGTYHHSPKSKYESSSDIGKVGAWIFTTYLTNAEKFSDKVTVYHHNRCGRCGHQISGVNEIGLGPDCAAILDGVFIVQTDKR